MTSTEGRQATLEKLLRVLAPEDWLVNVEPVGTGIRATLAPRSIDVPDVELIILNDGASLLTAPTSGLDDLDGCYELTPDFLDALSVIDKRYETFPRQLG